MPELWTIQAKSLQQGNAQQSDAVEAVNTAIVTSTLNLNLNILGLATIAITRITTQAPNGSGCTLNLAVKPGLMPLEMVYSRITTQSTPMVTNLPAVETLN